MEKDADRRGAVLFSRRSACTAALFGGWKLNRQMFRGVIAC